MIQEMLTKLYIKIKNDDASEEEIKLYIELTTFKFYTSNS